jgi:hypothetical protein
MVRTYNAKILNAKQPRSVCNFMDIKQKLLNIKIPILGISLSQALHLFISICLFCSFPSSVTFSCQEVLLASA